MAVSFLHYGDGGVDPSLRAAELYKLCTRFEFVQVADRLDDVAGSLRREHLRC
jgi:hypothetical protein